MASTTSSKEIDRELPPLLRVYKDGTVERFLGSSFVPPSSEDPETGVSSKDIVISENPKISARLHLPKHDTQQKLPIFVYYHGGAFCLESAFSFLHHRYLNIIASQANVLVVSIEYRLAPEHPLPAAYEDGWHALKWITSHNNENNHPINSDTWLIEHGDFNRFYIGGDTSGANIAHNALLRIGGGESDNLGGVKINGALLAFPLFWSSKTILSEPIEGHEKSSAMLVWNFVYPDAVNGIDNPLINPLASEAPSLDTLGCPKILIFVAGKDDLRDRGIWYYDGVKKSGWKGDVELVHVEGEEHCFQIYHPETQNSKDMIARIASFLV